VSLVGAVVPNEDALLSEISVQGMLRRAQYLSFPNVACEVRRGRLSLEIADLPQFSILHSVWRTAC
jgi:hypothetical protein